MLSDDYYIYSNIVDIYRMDKLISERNFQEVLEFQKENEFKSYMISLLYEQMIALLRYGEKNDALETLKKFIELDDELKYDFVPQIDILIKLLSGNGLKQEERALLQDYEKYAFSPDRLTSSLLMDLIKLYYQTRDKDQLDQLIKIISFSLFNNKMSTDDVRDRLDFCLTLCYIDKYKEASLYFQEMIDCCLNQENRPTRLRFMNMVFERSRDHVLYRMLTQIDNIDHILKANVYSFSYSTQKNFNKYVIEFFIKTGKFADARELAMQLDHQEVRKTRTDKSHFYRDHYNYYMGKIYLGEKFNRDLVLKYARQIHNQPYLKFGLLSDYSHNFDPDEYPGIFFEIVEIALDVNIEEKYARYFYLGGIAKILIDKGFDKKAIGIIDMVKYIQTQSILVYELSQLYVNQYNMNLAMGLLKRYSLDDDMKAYIMSKIAAKLYVENKTRAAIKWFKRSIDLVMQSDVGDLEIILDDYYHAKWEGKIVRTEAWHRFTKVQ